jgi:hypothetical protein
MPLLYFYVCFTQYRSLCYHDEYDKSPIPTILAMSRYTSLSYSSYFVGGSILHFHIAFLHATGYYVTLH